MHFNSLQLVAIALVANGWALPNLKPQLSHRSVGGENGDILGFKQVTKVSPNMPRS